jgi:hypothetical protein
MRFLLLFLGGVLGCAQMRAQEPASLIPEGKLVLAHYMTKMVPSADGEALWSSPELYSPQGSMGAIGGLNLTLPAWTKFRPKMTLDQAADFEIRAARQMGVDGFQFYYPLFPSLAPMRDYNRIVAAFIRVAEERHPGFKVTLCLAQGGELRGSTEGQRIELWGGALRELFAATGKSKAWLRTRKGSFLFYQWETDGFADNVGPRAITPVQVGRVATAFAELTQRTGQPIEWVYHVRPAKGDDAVVGAILSQFPAIWGWVDSDDDPAYWDRLALRCAAQGVAYTQTVYPDYFTSKVYALGDKDYRMLSPADALKVGGAKIERHYRQTDLAKGQSKLLQAAIDRKAAVINYATWNDWPEGHHLAPEANHNFGPSLLLRSFAARWRGQPDPMKDSAAVFFKKYPSSAKPRFPVHVAVKSLRNLPAAEDELQIASVLSVDARCEINGRPVGSATAGFSITSLPITADGPMRIRFVAADGRALVDFTTPFGPNRAPVRSDRLTYSYSSRCEAEYRLLFGEQPPLVPTVTWQPGKK